MIIGLSPYLRAILQVALGIFGALLLFYAFTGQTVHSPLNAESFVAFSFLLLLVLRAGGDQTVPLEQPQAVPAAMILPALLLLCLATFYHSLGKPLLFDDYGHVTFASQAHWSEILAAFYRPHPDIFFRPLGFLSYFVDFQWANFNPFRWHLWNLAIHTLNCACVYIVARQLEFPPVPSVVAAAIFAVHGTRAETVCWTDARFDLLSTLFVLLTLISLEQHIRQKTKSWLAGSYFFTVLAICTKEAAFAIPLILIVVSLFHSGERRRFLLRTVPGVFAITVAAFVYRLWMIKGIGGYQTDGHANIFIFSAFRSAKGLFWRLWALAFFPINWSGHVSLILPLTMAAFLVLLAVVASSVRVNKTRLLGALLLTLAASLPVEHLLLIGSDLAGARILYLPMLGIALFWAVACEAQSGRGYLVYATPAVVLCFNLACLEGNITNWTQVAEAARSVCQTFGQQIAKVPGPVQVTGLPSKYRGVYFLTNGFADCVHINSGVPASRIVTNTRDSAPQNTYHWNDKSRSFDRMPLTIP